MPYRIDPQTGQEVYMQPQYAPVTQQPTDTIYQTQTSSKSFLLGILIPFTVIAVVWLYTKRLRHPKDKNAMEQHFFYRLIRVLYVLSVWILIPLWIFIFTYIDIIGDTSAYGFLWVYVGIAIIYSLLNIIRDGLIYIFLGKPFNWDWFTELISIPRGRIVN